MLNDLFAPFARTPGGATFDCRPKPTCDPRPVCPACGGLECLCRPRFFAGQLLTDEDLNRLDHYIVAKNRMRNRYLFGWGVACGLEVVCTVCEPAGGSHVVVKPGYALSPCGNDIVVCNQESVDVCDLINRCRTRAPDDCAGLGVPAPGSVSATGPNLAAAANTGEPLRGRNTALPNAMALNPNALAPARVPPNPTEQWVLAICYKETPSRGVTALRGASGASCGCGNPGCACCGKATATTNGRTGCGCNGTTAKTGAQGGCGCNGATGGTSTTSASPRQLPAQCEPTLTCEGYSFAVYKVPPKSGTQIDYGALVTRFLCCVQGLFQQLPAQPGAVAPQDQLTWLNTFQGAVSDFLANEGLYDCDLAQRLAGVPVPTLGGAATVFERQIQTAAFDTIGIAVAVLRKCLCSALLPPCPDPAMADCVPIATLTVDRGQCRVRQVCNLSNRRFLLSFPAIEYWLSWLPIFRPWTGAGPDTTLRGRLESMCCPTTDPMQNVRGSAQVLSAKVAEPVAAVKARAAGDPFAEVLSAGVTRGRPMDPATLVLAALGATDPNGGPLASATELAYPAETLLTQQAFAPMLAAMLPGILTGRAAGAGADEAAQLGQTVDELSRQVAALKARLDDISGG